MPAARQEGELARTHEGEPGLPRGRHGLPFETVRAAQRERLLRAVIATVSKAGFSNVTVADIVRDARVSKAAFYAHFTDKEDCFLAATREGGRLMIDRVADAARRLPPETGAEDALRASVAAFLEFLVEEPAFARSFYVEMPAAGSRAVERFDAAQHAFARLNRAWHERARRDHPDWPAVPDQAYYALAGATTELVRAKVRRDKTHAVRDLEDTIVALLLAVLAGRRWPAELARGRVAWRGVDSRAGSETPESGGLPEKVIRGGGRHRNQNVRVRAQEGPTAGSRRGDRLPSGRSWP